MPRKSGREVLAEIKSDPDLKRIPILVMTTSTAEQDIAKAYSLNANCYIAKPLELGEFIDVVQSIEEFWLTRASLPSNPEPFHGSRKAVCMYQAWLFELTELPTDRWLTFANSAMNSGFSLCQTMWPDCIHSRAAGPANGLTSSRYTDPPT